MSSGATIIEDVPSDVAGLRRALIAQREYTLALYAGLPDAYWIPDQFPYLATVNPPLWELAHIGWFQEFFVLRWRADDVTAARIGSCLQGADQIFDSARVAHRTRWTLAYPSKAVCFDYMQRILNEVIAALEKDGGENPYGFQLALLHEDMHAEALAMTLITLGLPLPGVVGKRARLHPSAHLKREIELAGGELHLGASERAFRFDNEKPPCKVRVIPFAIDARVTSAAEFGKFVVSNAYRDPQFWSPEGNAWRQGKGDVDACSAKSSEFAAMHVNYFEAEAYCRWAGRRLPLESEWEFAATTSAEFFASTGHVWEWTASPFEPYPGFEAERYRDYSAPWFHSHRVLKGGSFVTHPRLKYPQYRNFYTPERSDMFCGFRTCAIR